MCIRSSLFSLASFAALTLCLAGSPVSLGQNPVYPVPSNYPSIADPIGIPPNSSTDGTNETVATASGSLNIFIPVLSLPQNNGSTLTLGFTHSSATYALREETTASAVGGLVNGWTEVVTPREEYKPVAPPLQINLPTLSASIVYMGLNGTWYWGCPYAWPCTVSEPPNGLVNAGTPVYAVSNFVFRDWAGNAHTFPTSLDGATGQVTDGIAEYSQNITGIQDCATCVVPFAAPSLHAESSDGTVLSLDMHNKSDITVTDKHGTVYHFKGYSSPFCQTIYGCTLGNGWYPTNGGAWNGITQDQFYADVASSIVDTNGNSISIVTDTTGIGNGPFKVEGGSYTLTDTVGRVPRGIRRRQQQTEMSSRTTMIRI